jgi:hypothetical protein
MFTFLLYFFHQSQYFLLHYARDEDDKRGSLRTLFLLAFPPNINQITPMELRRAITIPAMAMSFAVSAVSSSLEPELEAESVALFDDRVGKAESKLITKFDITSNLGLPRPVDASQPGFASYEY